MVSTPEEVTDNSPISPIPSMTVKTLSASKSLRQFSEVLYFKNTAVHRFGAAKSRRKAIRSGSIL